MNIKTKRDLEKFENLLEGRATQEKDIDNLQEYVLESLMSLDRKDINLESYAAQKNLALKISTDIRKLAKQKNWWEKKFLLV